MFWRLLTNLGYCFACSEPLLPIYNDNTNYHNIPVIYEERPFLEEIPLTDFLAMGFEQPEEIMESYHNLFESDPNFYV